MKTKTREKVFETNSSSMHSIVILKDGRTSVRDARGFRYLHNGTWEIWDHDIEFDRSPFTMLRTMEEKAKYAIASFCGYASNEARAEFMKELLDILRKYVPGIKEIKLPEEHCYEYLDAEGNRLSRDDLYWKNMDECLPNPRYEAMEEAEDDDAEEDEDEKTYAYQLPDGRYMEVFATGNMIAEPYYGYVDHQSTGLLQGFLKRKGITLEEFLSDTRYVIAIDGDEYYELENICKSGIVDVDAFTVYQGGEEFEMSAGEKESEEDEE